MYEFNIFSYDNVENNKKGNFSIGWVKFNNGLFDGRETLLKNIAGEDPEKSSLIYPNDENFDIFSFNNIFSFIDFNL